jgi:PAS domain-containing protein
MANHYVDQDQYLISTTQAPSDGNAASWENTTSPLTENFESNQSHETQQTPNPPHFICQQQFFSASSWASQYQHVFQLDQFDIFRALDKLATRQDAKGNHSAVDESDSFVVVDLWQHDSPIIYVSDNFSSLTGYSREEAIGRNARFLQSPDGVVQAGATRDHISSASAWELNQQIAQGQEFQYVVKNFRKNREPFLNLLTIIPLPEDTPATRYMFGVQVELSPSQSPDWEFNSHIEAPPVS